MTCTSRRWLGGVAVLGWLLAAGCGEDDPGGGGGTDAGRDSSIPIDSGGDATVPDGSSSDLGGGDASMEDGSSPGDAEPGDAGGDAEPVDAGPSDAGPCEPLVCEPTRGCRYEGTTCTSCGTLVCEDGGMTECVDCPALSECCMYDAPTCESCGDPICFTVDCAAPPPGCHYEGGSCRSCGTLVCEGEGIPCGPTRCNEGEVCCNESCGICTPPDGICTDELCDGDAGPAGVACGARAGDTCTRSEWCDFSDRGLCGAADATGVCRPRPEACTAVFMPVCGCDGMDYSNACSAHAAGTDDAREGTCDGGSDACATVLCAEGTACQVCRTPDGGSEARCLGRGETCDDTSMSDCRTTGCPMGMHCDACRAVGGVRYVCLPDGAVC